MGEVCRVVADVTGAYDPDLRISRFVRRITYRRPDLVVIHDRIESDVPHEYRWLLHTDPQQRFTEMRPGYWRLEAGGVGMDICVLEPGSGGALSRGAAAPDHAQPVRGPDAPAGPVQRPRRNTAGVPGGAEGAARRAAWQTCR